MLEVSCIQTVIAISIEVQKLFPHWQNINFLKVDLHQGNKEYDDVAAVFQRETRHQPKKASTLIICYYKHMLIRLSKRQRLTESSIGSQIWNWVRLREVIL